MVKNDLAVGECVVLSRSKPAWGGVRVANSVGDEEYIMTGKTDHP